MSKYNERLEDLIDHQLIDDEDILKKKKLGGVGYRINGNMCLGIYNNLLVARIGKGLAKTLTQKSGIRPYLEGDDDFDEFILIEDSIYNHSKALNKFINQSIDYTTSLPPKEQDQDELET